MKYILLILHAITSYVFAEEIFNDPLDMYSSGWITNITSGPGIVQQKNTTCPLPPVPQKGCFEISADSLIQKQFSTLGFNQISISFSFTTFGGSLGDVCKIETSIANGPFIPLDSLDSGGCPCGIQNRNGITLDGADDTAVTIRFTTKAQSTNPSFKCYFSNLIIDGFSMVTTTVFATTILPTPSPIGPNKVTLGSWALDINTNTGTWAEINNGGGAFTATSAEFNCAFAQTPNACWNLKPNYNVEKNISTAGFDNVELHYSLRKVGNDPSAKCQISCNGFS
eukprot:125139_1